MLSVQEMMTIYMYREMLPILRIIPTVVKACCDFAVLIDAPYG